jgi:hypothetical protein
MNTTKTSEICSMIIDLENEIEFMKQENIGKGIRKKQHDLKQLHIKLKKISQAEKLNKTEDF